MLYKPSKKIEMIITGCTECPYLPHPFDSLAVCTHPAFGNNLAHFPMLPTRLDLYPDWCPLPDVEGGK